MGGPIHTMGDGDPTIGRRFLHGQKVEDPDEADPTALFRAWADTLKALGITRVAGHVIGDDDLFDDVPLGNAWIAPVLHGRGYATAEIARRLRVSDVTVRQYLRDAGVLAANPRPAQDGRQLPLF